MKGLMLYQALRFFKIVFWTNHDWTQITIGQIMCPYTINQSFQISPHYTP